MNTSPMTAIIEYTPVKTKRGSPRGARTELQREFYRKAIINIRKAVVDEWNDSAFICHELKTAAQSAGQFGLEAKERFMKDLRLPAGYYHPFLSVYPASARLRSDYKMDDLPQTDIEANKKRVWLLSALLSKDPARIREARDYAHRQYGLWALDFKYDPEAF